jgi:hypothetical protein
MRAPMLPMPTAPELPVSPASFPPIVLTTMTKVLIPRHLHSAKTCPDWPSITGPCVGNCTPPSNASIERVQNSPRRDRIKRACRVTNSLPSSPTPVTQSATVCRSTSRRITKIVVVPPDDFTHQGNQATYPRRYDLPERGLAPPPRLRSPVRDQ